jgi:hypothetical protein
MTRYSIYKKLVLQDERSKKLNFNKDGRKHYVYRVTDYSRIKEQHYIGSRTSSKDNLLEDFWLYRTSSKHNVLNENKKEQYKIKILKVFDNPGDKMVYEAFLHQFYNVKLHKSFWNKSNQTPFGFDTTGEVTVISNGKFKNISKKEYDKGNYKQTNKGYVVTKEQGRVKKEIYINDELTHINKGKMDIIENNKLVKIDCKDYDREKHITPRHNKIIVFDKILNKNITINKKDFDPEIHHSVNKGIVTAIDKSKKPYKVIKVSKEEYDENENLVGSNTLLIKIFDKNDNLIIEELGKIKDILKNNDMPISLSANKNKKYKVNTYHKNENLIQYLKKFEGWYWTSERISS